jgi:hypothetical protein
MRRVERVPDIRRLSTTDQLQVFISPDAAHLEAGASWRRAAASKRGSGASAAPASDHEPKLYLRRSPYMRGSPYSVDQ